MKAKILEIIAAAAVLAGLSAVPCLVWWYDDYTFRARFGENARIIKLTAAADQGRVTTWRVGGYNYWSGNFPRLDKFTVNKGDNVVLVITSADVTHSFKVTPELKVKQPITIEGGHTEVATFTADRAGLYFFECRSLCGDAHHAMFFRIDVSGVEAGQNTNQEKP